jgi:hypothetical protein
VYKKTKIILILFALTSLSWAQRSNSNSVFISFFAGDLSILSENFTDIYDSKNNLVLGLGFGIPLSGSITFDGSVFYYKKEADFTSADPMASLENALLKQIIFNAGFQYHLLPNRIVGLSFLCGANYALVNEEHVFSGDEPVYKLDGNGNLGLYGGANFEISFGKGPVALFGDVKYTYSWNPILEYDNTYRDIKYTGGLKLYLSQRWK